MAPQTQPFAPSKPAPETYGLAAMQALMGYDASERSAEHITAEHLSAKVNGGWLDQPQRKCFDALPSAKIKKLVADAVSADLTEDESTPRGYGAWLRATMDALVEAAKLDAAQKALRG